MKKVFLLLSLSITFVTNSFACKCDIYASLETFLEERYKASDFVISAKAEFVKDSLTKGNYNMLSDPAYWRQGGYNAVLKVNKVYKGEIKTETVEITPNWSDCSQYFKTGDTYIIFGFVNKKGELNTNTCSGNFSIAKENRLKQFSKIKKE